MPCRTRLWSILAIALTGMPSCGDPTEPATEQSGARLTVDVLVFARFASDPKLTARVTGWMTPGRDAGGRLREVESPLRVAGQAVDLTFPVRSDWATMETVVSLSPVGGLATFTVEAPVVAGVQPTIPVATINTLRLADPDTVMTSLDGSLTLHPQIDPVTGGATPPPTRQWVLMVSGKSAISINVVGPLPAEIVVPRELMPPSVSSWSMQLGINDTYGPPAFTKPGGDYDVIVRLSQVFYRTVLPPVPAATR